MNTIISNIIGAATNVAITGIAISTILFSYVQAVDFICPHLHAAVNHQEQSVATYELLFPGPRAQQIRQDWNAKKLDATNKILALQQTASNLKITASNLLHLNSQN